VEYLIPDAKQMGVWNSTIDILTSLGYVVGKNLRSAPFDWRLSPTSFLAYDFPRLKNLVEEMYVSNGNKKIACVSLSMGGPYFLSFLNNAVSQAWKDKYIHSWSTWEGAFGGSLSSALAVVSPKSLYAQFLGRYAVLFMDMLRSFPSFIWMMPITQYVGTGAMIGNTVANYTADDWVQLLYSVGANGSAQALQDMVAKNLTTFQPPGVPTYCAYGVQVPTPGYAYFNATNFDVAPVITQQDGDGAVLLDGLAICERWKNTQKQHMETFTVPGMVHGGSVHNKAILAYFVKTLFA